MGELVELLANRLETWIFEWGLRWSHQPGDAGHLPQGWVAIGQRCLRSRSQPDHAWGPCAPHVQLFLMIYFINNFILQTTFLTKIKLHSSSQSKQLQNPFLYPIILSSAFSTLSLPPQPPFPSLLLSYFLIRIFSLFINILSLTLGFLLSLIKNNINQHISIYVYRFLCLKLDAHSF